MAETIMPAYSEQGDLNAKFGNLVQLIGPVPSGSTVQGEIDTNTGAIANINTPSLISVSDLNSLTTPGRYSLGGNYTNAPKQNLYGYVDVVTYGSNTHAQTVYSFASTGSTIYERRLSGTTWGSWEELALNRAVIERVIQLDLGATTTSNNPMAVLQESFASMEAGVSYTGKIRTSLYTWLYTGLKHTATYGVFNCWTYISADAPQIIRNYNGTWSSEELAPMSKNGSNDKASATSIATGVSLNQLIVTQIGKLVGVIIEIATTAQIAANTHMFTGCPASGINDAVIYGINNTSGTIIPFLVNSAGWLTNKEAIPSGASIRISQTYTSA